jgi:hypothetical protein
MLWACGGGRRLRARAAARPPSEAPTWGEGSEGYSTQSRDRYELGGAPTITMFKLEAAAWGKSSAGVGGAPLVTAIALERRAAQAEDIARWRPWRGETSAAVLPLPACVRRGRWWWSCLDPCTSQPKRAIEGHRPAWTANRCHGKWGAHLRKAESRFARLPELDVRRARPLVRHRFARLCRPVWA